MSSSNAPFNIQSSDQNPSFSPKGARLGPYILKNSNFSLIYRGFSLLLLLKDEKYLDFVFARFKNRWRQVKGDGSILEQSW